MFATAALRHACRVWPDWHRTVENFRALIGAITTDHFPHLTLSTAPLHMIVLLLSLRPESIWLLRGHKKVVHFHFQTVTRFGVHTAL
jgi:hypothetical protein